MEQAILSIPGVEIGEVIGVCADGRPLIGGGDEGTGRPAEVVWSAAVPDWESCRGCRVVLAFEGGDTDRPIVLGLLDAPPVATPERPRDLRVESDRSIVIECGKARIALRADGRIEIRGGHLISRSSGPNKVKGASVHIN